MPLNRSVPKALILLLMSGQRVPRCVPTYVATQPTTLPDKKIKRLKGHHWSVAKAPSHRGSEASNFRPLADMRTDLALA